MHSTPPHVHTHIPMVIAAEGTGGLGGMDNVVARKLGRRDTSVVIMGPGLMGSAVPI